MSGPTPKHLESSPAGLRAARAVLIVGAVLSAAAAIGTVWLVRAAVLIAVLAGVIAAVVLVRELAARRRAHGEQLRRLEIRHRSQLSDERHRTASVLDTLDARLADQRAGVALERSAARATIEKLRADVLELTDRLQRLEHDLVARDETIAALRERQAELSRRLWHEGVLDTALPQQLRTDPDDADIHLMPRHGVSRTSAESRNWGNLEVELPSERTGS